MTLKQTGAFTPTGRPCVSAMQPCCRLCRMLQPSALQEALLQARQGLLLLRPAAGVPTPWYAHSTAESVSAGCCQQFQFPTGTSSSGTARLNRLDLITLLRCSLSAKAPIELALLRGESFSPELNAYCGRMVGTFLVPHLKSVVRVEGTSRRARR
jgi:hypothetical protein